MAINSTTHTDRPEKDHAAQLRSLAELFKRHPHYRGDVRMVLIGGCRNDEDSARVESLKQLASELNISVRLPPPSSLLFFPTLI